MEARRSLLAILTLILREIAGLVMLMPSLETIHIYFSICPSDPRSPSCNV